MLDETFYAYERTPYRRSLTTRVRASGKGDHGPWLELEDTVLYPEGGGQPADRGSVAGIAVLEVQKVDGNIRHFLDPRAIEQAASDAAQVLPADTWLPDAEVEVKLDWKRRFDHMQQHSAQHLLSALAADCFGWPTTSFHLGPEICDIEIALDGPGAAGPSETTFTALESAVAEAIREDRTISAKRLEPDAVDLSALRSRGLPVGHRGSIRLVEINGLDTNTCGGTHVRSTAEIECLTWLGSEPKRGGLCLSWIAGGRVRKRMRAHEARNGSLRRVLGTADSELVTVAASKLDQIKELERQRKGAEGRWAEAVALGLVAEAKIDLAEAGQAHPPLMCFHAEDVEAATLGQIARASLAALPSAAFFSSCENSTGAFFVLAAGDQCDLDVPAVGSRLAQTLDGRGGGRGKHFQGRAGSLAEREKALATLRQALEESP